MKTGERMELLRAPDKCLQQIADELGCKVGNLEYFRHYHKLPKLCPVKGKALSAKYVRPAPARVNSNNALTVKW